MTDLECDEIIEKYSSTTYVPVNGVSNLGSAMALVLNNSNKCYRLRIKCVGDAQMSDHMNNNINMNSLEQQLQKLCLPYLRIAALLRHHIYQQNLPEISSPQMEFVRLVYYLELVTESSDWNSFNASKGLCFISGTEFTLPKFWCEQLIDILPTQSVRELIINQHLTLQQPRLMELPREYDRLFTV